MPENTVTDRPPAWTLTTDTLAGRPFTTAVDAQGGMIGFAFPSADPDRGWCLAVVGLAATQAYCADQAHALKWLQHLADLSTRLGAEAVSE